jgi:hypothetical protein
MEYLAQIYNWFAESPWERISLALLIANTIAQKTPWKQDDDVLAVIGDIIAAIFKRGK